MKKIIVAAVAVLSIIPAAAFAAANTPAPTVDPYAPPAHFVQPPKLNCAKGGIITDMTVTDKTGARSAFDTIRWTMQRYQQTCGTPESVKILITNGK